MAGACAAGPRGGERIHGVSTIDGTTHLFDGADYRRIDTRNMVVVVEHTSIGSARLWWDDLQHGIRGDTSNGFIDYLDRYTAGTTTVGAVVQELSAAAGLQPSDLDVTEVCQSLSGWCRPDETLVNALVRAHRWRRRIGGGQAKSITDLREQEGVTVAFVCRLLPLTCLAPDIIQAILDGRQPHGRVAFLPFGKLTLKSAKPKPFRDPPQTLGDHLRRRRIELGLQQKEVALRLCVNEWTIHNWEAGRTKPAVRFLPRIIGLLGYDPLPVSELAGSLGQMLTMRRRKLGLARKRAAKLLAVDEATLARWERNEARPSGQRVGRIEALLTGSDDKSELS